MGEVGEQVGKDSIPLLEIGIVEEQTNKNFLEMNWLSLDRHSSFFHSFAHRLE